MTGFRGTVWLHSFDANIGEPATAFAADPGNPNEEFRAEKRRP